MIANPDPALRLLEQQLIARHPAEAAQLLERMPPAQIALTLAAHPVTLTLPVWERLVADIAGQALGGLAESTLKMLLEKANPSRGVTWLAACEPARQQRYLNLLEPALADEYRALMAFPSGTAGSLMDPRVLAFRPEMTIREGVHRLRASQRRNVRSVFVVDADSRLLGFVAVQELALAPRATPLQEVMRPAQAYVDATASREHVVATMEQHQFTDLPVLDLDGRLIGVIRPHALFNAVENEASASLQTMVGVSKDERALSRVLFSVRKRLPWLQINLLTAFLAAAVVGMFEDTIARFTALAVLLPVVAGQSGNTGAQALAVTMRGLALREIRISHWSRLIVKEAAVGFWNGVAVAVVTAAGVWVWSGSSGLAAVIWIAMILSMVIAGVSGATIPLLLTRFGLDPAQSSSIFLTTVTDVAGFLSFLGIASLMAAQL